MTESEFRKRLETENLHVPGHVIKLNCGLIHQDSDSNFIVGCTQAVSKGKWYIFSSDEFHYEDRDTSRPLYEMRTERDLKGKKRTYPVPLGVSVMKSFTNQEEALDAFYNYIKKKSR